MIHKIPFGKLVNPKTDKLDELMKTHGEIKHQIDAFIGPEVSLKNRQNIPEKKAPVTVVRNEKLDKNENRIPLKAKKILNSNQLSKKLAEPSQPTLFDNITANIQNRDEPVTAASGPISSQVGGGDPSIKNIPSSIESIVGAVENVNRSQPKNLQLPQTSILTQPTVRKHTDSLGANGGDKQMGPKERVLDSLQHTQQRPGSSQDKLNLKNVRVESMQKEIHTPKLDGQKILDNVKLNATLSKNNSNANAEPAQKLESGEQSHRNSQDNPNLKNVRVESMQKEIHTPKLDGQKILDSVKLNATLSKNNSNANAESAQKLEPVEQNHRNSQGNPNLKNVRVESMQKEIHTPKLDGQKILDNVKLNAALSKNSSNANAESAQKLEPGEQSQRNSQDNPNLKNVRVESMQKEIHTSKLDGQKILDHVKLNSTLSKNNSKQVTQPQPALKIEAVGPKMPSVLDNKGSGERLTAADNTMQPDNERSLEANSDKGKASLEFFADAARNKAHARNITSSVKRNQDVPGSGSTKVTSKQSSSSNLGKDQKLSVIGENQRQNRNVAPQPQENIQFQPNITLTPEKIALGGEKLMSQNIIIDPGVNARPNNSRKQRNKLLVHHQQAEQRLPTASESTKGSIHRTSFVESLIAHRPSESIVDERIEPSTDSLKEQLRSRIKILNKAQESLNIGALNARDQDQRIDQPLQSNPVQTKATAQQQGMPNARVYPYLFARNIAMGIIEKIRAGSINQKPQMTGISQKFSVDAGQMGNLQIKFQQNSGKEQISIFVENDSIKNDMLKIVPQIEENLKQRDLNFSSLDVEVSTNPKEKEFTEQQDRKNSHSAQTEDSLLNQEGSSTENSTLNRKYGYNTLEVLA